MSISPHQGYGPDQVDGLTLNELADLVAGAIDEFGGDAEVVTYDGSQRYGAKYGTIAEEVTFERPMTVVDWLEER